MGRPRKKIDPGVVYHMTKNNAPVAAIAKFFKVHRDTLYANFKEEIKEGRALYYKELYARIDAYLEKCREENRLKDSAKTTKRKYRTKGSHPIFW